MMSADLQERRTRAERKIKELLSAMDSNVEELYLSLLQHDVEKDDITDDQEAQRLEGFHDYIIVREQVGVEHPSLEDFLRVREEYPEKLISFGTGKRRTIEYDEDEFETVSDERMSVLAESGDIEIIGNDEVEEFELKEEEFELKEEEFEPEEEEFEPEEESPVGEYTDIVQEAIATEHEKDLPSPIESVESETPSEGKANPKSTSFFGDSPKNVLEIVEEKVEKIDPNVNAGRLTQQIVSEKEFSNKTGGYNKDQVDDFFDEIVAFMDATHSVEEYDEMIASMRKVSFKKERFRSGFLPAEVDGFLEAVIGELEVQKIAASKS